MTRAKRSLDLVISSGALLLLAPLLLILALLVWRFIGPPVLFRQTRAGRGGVPFRLYKFRTMTDARGADGAPLPDAARLTRLGRRLRASSLDELPELWNVLRGDMSLVGPRPLLTRYTARYSPDQRRRLEVTPGLTGWAQINGRNALSWEARFALDVWYVDHASLTLDLLILWRTLRQVARRDGVSAHGHATMPEFGAEFGGPS